MSYTINSAKDSQGNEQLFMELFNRMRPQIESYKQSHGGDLEGAFGAVTGTPWPSGRSVKISHGQPLMTKDRTVKSVLGKYVALPAAIAAGGYFAAPAIASAMGIGGAGAAGGGVVGGGLGTGALAAGATVPGAASAGWGTVAAGLGKVAAKQVGGKIISHYLGNGQPADVQQPQVQPQVQPQTQPPLAPPPVPRRTGSPLSGDFGVPKFPTLSPYGKAF